MKIKALFLVFLIAFLPIAFAIEFNQALGGGIFKLSQSNSEDAISLEYEYAVDEDGTEGVILNVDSDTKVVFPESTRNCDFALFKSYSLEKHDWYKVVNNSSLYSMMRYYIIDEKTGITIGAGQICSGTGEEREQVHYRPYDHQVKIEIYYFDCKVCEREQTEGRETNMCGRVSCVNQCAYQGNRRSSGACFEGACSFDKALCPDSSCTEGKCTTKDCPNNCAPYCDGSRVYNKGFCTNSTCKYPLWTECKYGCSSLACSVSQCAKTSDCGSNGYTGSKYCKSGDVWQKYRSYNCKNPDSASSSCESLDTERRISSCTNGCSNGKCETSSSTSCSSSRDCGTNEFVGSDYCSNGDVYKDYRNYSCNSGNCSFTDSKVKRNNCTEGCSNGSCSSQKDSVGDEDYCVGKECVQGLGDCDSDSECADGLKCVENVGADYSMDAETDVCLSNALIRKNYSEKSYAQYKTPVLKLAIKRDGSVTTQSTNNSTGSQAGWDYNITTNGEIKFNAFDGALCVSAIQNAMPLPVTTIHIKGKHISGKEHEETVKIVPYIHADTFSLCWIVTTQDKDGKYTKCYNKCQNNKTFKDILKDHVVVAPDYSFKLDSSAINDLVNFYNKNEYIDPAGLPLILGGSAIAVIGVVATIYAYKKVFAGLGCFVLFPPLNVIACAVAVS